MSIIFAVFSVWGAAVVVKAANALREGRAYTFSMWDGGMLRAGKTLSRTGTQIKIVTGALLSLGCVGQMTGLLRYPMGAYVVMAAAVASILSDLMTTV
jgi:hypothetical protein